MKSRRGLCAALLLAAVSAGAQTELRAVPESAAPLSFAPALPAGASMLAGLAIGPGPLLAPAAFAPPAAAAVLAAPAATPAPIPAVAAEAVPAPLETAAPETAHARAETIRGAVAEFDRLDFQALDAVGARTAGDDLMRRALGGAAEDPTVFSEEQGAPTRGGLAPAGRGLYLLSKPLRETVQLGPVARVAHVGASIGWEIFKAWVGWHATGHVMGAVAVLVVELPFSPALMSGRTLLDLGLRYWRRQLAVLKELARVPGVERIRVLTAGHVEFSGPIARRKENTGLIFVDATQAPPDGRFGAAIPIADASRQQVRLTFTANGETAAAVWTPTLADLLDRRPLPPVIAAAWRSALKDVSRARAPARRLLETALGGSLRIEALLVGDASGDRDLGAIVEGAAVKTFIGLGRLDRLRALLRRKLKARSIPLTDSAIVPADAPREPGPRAWLMRAWRRLTGRLLVAPTSL